jgi:hypothetical protein
VIILNETHQIRQILYKQIFSQYCLIDKKKGFSAEGRRQKSEKGTNLARKWRKKLKTFFARLVAREHIHLLHTSSLYGRCFDGKRSSTWKTFTSSHNRNRLIYLFFGSPLVDSKNTIPTQKAIASIFWKQVVN